MSTLLVAGDYDPYNQIARFVELYQLLPKGELAIIPGCGHVVLACVGYTTFKSTPLPTELVDRLRPYLAPD